MSRPKQNSQRAMVSTQQQTAIFTGQNQPSKPGFDAN